MRACEPIPPGGGAAPARLRASGRGALLVVLAIWALVFGRAAGFGFVWDDRDTILENRLLTEAPLADALRATQHDHHGGGAPDGGYHSWRPLQTLSNRVDVGLFGPSPRAMHVHNLLLAVLAVLLVHRIAAALLGRPGPALAVAALFALHPLQVEVPCYVSARGDLLAAVGALLAAAGFVGGLRSGAGPGRRVAGAVFAALGYAVALGAKESAAPLPAALGLLAMAQGRLRPAAPLLAAQAAVLLAYVGVRLALGAGSGAAENGLVHAVAILPALALQYAATFVVPVALSIERPAVEAPALLVTAWIPAVAAAALGGWAVLRTTPGSPARLIAAGLAWFALMLAPSALAVGVTGVAADRYAYLPVFGLAVAAVAAVAPHARCRGRWLLPAAAWGGLLLVVTALQVSTWRNEETLYTHALRSEPDSSMAHYHVGTLLAQRGAWGEAVPRLERAVSLDSTNVRALQNLGAAYLLTGRLSAAEEALRRALALTDGASWRAWAHLARVEVARGRSDEACAALDRLLRLRPDHVHGRREAERRCPGLRAGTTEAATEPRS